MEMRRLWFIVVALSFLSTSVTAKKFANNYVEFDLPDRWVCRLEGGQHICQPISRDQQKEAIIVMAAKYKGPEDEIERYKARLSEKREVKDIKGKKYSSSSRYIKYTPILGTIWLDSMQESSEVPNFVTRYLATVQKGLGMVLTFSAHVSKAKLYNPDFMQMISSLRVRENIPAAEPEPRPEMTKLGPGIVAGTVDTGSKTGKPGERKGMEIPVQQRDNTLLYIIIAVVALLIIYVVIKRRKRNRRR